MFTIKIEDSLFMNVTFTNMFKRVLPMIRRPCVPKNSFTPRDNLASVGPLHYYFALTP